MSHGARGLTLLEVLVAIALAGALSGIALPQWRRTLADWRLQAAARQVVLDLKLARAQALAGGAARRVRFPAGGRHYQHERQQRGRYVPVAPATLLPGDVLIADCTAPGDGIGFRPRGLAAGFGTVILRDGRGVERRVVVDIAGRMRVS